MTIKPLKTAKQKNVRLNKYHYTRENINMMLSEGYAFYILNEGNGIKICRDQLNIFNASQVDAIFIPLDKVDKLKVIYDRESESYVPVVYLNDDNSSFEYLIVDL